MEVSDLHQIIVDMIDCLTDDDLQLPAGSDHPQYARIAFSSSSFGKLLSFMLKRRRGHAVGHIRNIIFATYSN